MMGAVEDKPRQKWSSQFEATMALVGYAVGLGNLCRFPYLCIRNGGGAFLIPYLIFMAFCGLPLYYLELSIAQFSGLSILNIWAMCPIIEGVGWTMLINSGIYCVYYSTFMAWGLYYLCMSFRADVPWKTCDNAWNTPSCIVLGENKSVTANTTEYLSHVSNNTAVNQSISSIATGQIYDRTAAGEFWSYKVLDISDGADELGYIKWQLLLCLGAMWFVIWLCLFRGTASIGKAVYVTVPMPYILITILLIRGVTLPGSLDGIRYYIIPDWNRLRHFKVWIEACLQVFFSLAVAWGGTITMASYNRFNNNCLRDAVITTAACASTSLYSGFAIFSLIGYMAHMSGVSMEEIITQGPGLAFVAYPEGLSKLPFSTLWAICFFLAIITLGLDSEFTTLEVITAALLDKYSKYLRKSWFLITTCMVLCCAAVVFISQGGMYWFQIVDWYVAAVGVLLCGLIECLVVGYVYGIGRFCSDMSLMYKKRPSFWWVISWCGIIPILVFGMLVMNCLYMTAPSYGAYQYPDWALVIGWSITIIPVMPIPIVALCKLIQTPGSFRKRIRTLLSPTDAWKPQDRREQQHYKRDDNTTWRQNMAFSVKSDKCQIELLDKQACNKLLG